MRTASFLRDSDGPTKLYQLAPEVLARSEQEIGQQQHDRGLRGNRGEQCGLRKRVVAQPGWARGLGRARCRLRACFRACSELGARYERRARIGSSPLEFVGGFLHVLQCSRSARARGAQIFAQFAGGLGQLLDHRRGVVAHQEADPGQAPDHHRQHQCRTDATRYAARPEPVHQRVQRVAREDADQQRDEETARQIQRGNDRNDRQYADRHVHAPVAGRAFRNRHGLPGCDRHLGYHLGLALRHCELRQCRGAASAAHDHLWCDGHRSGPRDSSGGRT